jgi:hypothetical protein
MRARKTSLQVSNEQKPSGRLIKNSTKKGFEDLS